MEGTQVTAAKNGQYQQQELPVKESFLCVGLCSQRDDVSLTAANLEIDILVFLKYNMMDTALHYRHFVKNSTLLKEARQLLLANVIE